MNIEADARLYTLNWRRRLDRRNAEFSCYASVDARSRFVFGMHANLDGRVDPFQVNAEAARTGEMDSRSRIAPNTSQYWLARLASADVVADDEALAEGFVDRHGESSAQFGEADEQHAQAALGIHVEVRE